MFRETLFFKTALYSAYDWLAKIRQLIFCRVPSALQLLSVSIFPNRSRGKIGKSVCAKENIPSDAFCPAERPTAET